MFKPTDQALMRYPMASVYIFNAKCIDNSRLFWKYFVDSDIAQIVCDHWRQTNKIAYSLYKDSKNQGFSYNLQLLRKKSQIYRLWVIPTLSTGH